MALIPKIELKLGTNCSTVNLIEDTGIYVALNNIGGWGTPNIDTDAIVSATVKIQSVAGALLQTITLKDTSVDYYSGAVTSPVPSSFTILSEETWNQLDGIYEIVYTVNDGTTNYINETQHELFLCKLCACKESLVSKLVKECDAQKLKGLKENLDQIEIFMYGIQTAFACGNFTQATTILTNATSYCQIVSDCNCGCSDC